MNKFKNWAKAHKPATIGISAVVAIALIATCVAIAMPKTHDEVKTDDKPISQVDGNGKINFDIKADDGWTKDSTPAIAHVTGSKTDDSKANDDVDFYHAISPAEDNHGTSSVEVPAGDYTVEFVSPVNHDGSAYEIYDTGKPIEVTVEPTVIADDKSDDVKDAVDEVADEAKERAEEQPAPDAEGSAVTDAEKAEGKAEDDKEAVIEQDIKKIPADQVTDEMLKDIVDKVNEAVENGDETLKGDAGKAVVEKLEGNVKANPNASEVTQSKAEETASSEAVNEPAKTPTAEPATKPSGNGGNSGNSGNSGNNNKPSEPAHTHSYNIPITEKVWVSKMVTVTDSPERTERVYDYTEYVFPEDGYRTTSRSDAFAHQEALFYAGREENYSEIEHFKTVTTPAKTHQEDQGHYEDKVVGYKCSCGATK